MTTEQQFQELLKNGEDRQAVRLFRYIFQQCQQLEQLTRDQEINLALGFVNMIALSELGRGEKNYVPDVNAMVNSVQQESKIINTIQEMIAAINQEFWMTTNDLLLGLEKEINSQLFSTLVQKCSQFLVSKHQKLVQAQGRSSKNTINSNKIIQEVNEFICKQQKLI